MQYFEDHFQRQNYFLFWLRWLPPTTPPPTLLCLVCAANQITHVDREGEGLKEVEVVRSLYCSGKKKEKKNTPK